MSLTPAKLANVLQKLFEHALLIKMYHFQTNRWGAHKAADDYYNKFQVTLDKFMEVAQGEAGTVATKFMPLELHTLTDQTIDAYLVEFANMLKRVVREPVLASIRDQMLTDLYQFRYLLTFK